MRTWGLALVVCGFGANANYYLYSCSLRHASGEFQLQKATFFSVCPCEWLHGSQLPHPIKLANTGNETRSCIHLQFSFFRLWYTTILIGSSRVLIKIKNEFFYQKISIYKFGMFLFNLSVQVFSAEVCLRFSNHWEQVSQWRWCQSRNASEEINYQKLINSIRVYFPHLCFVPCVLIKLVKAYLFQFILIVKMYNSVSIPM